MIKFTSKKTALRFPTYTVKFVNGLPWNAGDFADKGSCFWQERNIVRELLLNAGCKAIQIFDKNDKGIGRALLLPITLFGSMAAIIIIILDRNFSFYCFVRVIIN